MTIITTEQAKLDYTFKTMEEVNELSKNDYEIKKVAKIWQLNYKTKTGKCVIMEVSDLNRIYVYLHAIKLHHRLENGDLGAIL